MGVTASMSRSQRSSRSSWSDGCSIRCASSWARALWRQLDESVTQDLMGAMSRPPGLAHVEDSNVLDQVAQSQGVMAGVTPGEAGWWLGPVVLLWVQGAGSLAIVAF